MPIQNPLQLKERIISFIKFRGPSLPVHVAKEVQLSILFASAFLSELVSEKTIKISHMKVGGSPLYFISGQEPKLENFSHFLKSKEKDAFLLLKEKKFLKDIEQTPAIRVALRTIRDFAFPFRRNNEIFWKYFTVPESEFQEEKIKEIRKPEIKEIQEPVKIEEKKISISKPEIKVSQFEEIMDKAVKTKEAQKAEPKQLVKIKKKQPKKAIKKQEESFFNKIKESLNRKSIEIIDILGISKSQGRKRIYFIRLKYKKNK